MTTGVLLSHDIQLVPDPHLMESMRAVGYNLETAIADLVDNSITARAGAIDVLFSPEDDPYIAIVDDGVGMSRGEAQNAMRLAGVSSTGERDPRDLGRFGLGLKTASISQCRRVTLISKRGDSVHGFRWDLDYLVSTGSWSLQELDRDEIAGLPGMHVLDKHESGTMVLWTNLDRLTSATTDVSQTIDERMKLAREHLGLVFHRFLAGEHGAKLTISVNYRPIAGADPLLSQHTATQKGPVERIPIEGSVIEVRPFTLPHIAHLSEADRRRAQVGGTLRDSQGFYVYRALRLVIWGTWFRVSPKQELGKLARVRVDIPNTLDHLWHLDIKKSQAMPPPAIRNRLKGFADRIVAPSRRVHTYRGRSARVDTTRHLWDVIADRDVFRYEINRTHPALEALAATLDAEQLEAVETVLELVESNFPVDDVYNRIGQDEKHQPAGGVSSELERHGRRLWEAYRGRISADEFVDLMASSEPFVGDSAGRALLERIVAE
ncbi:ATP-binding protein [Sinomonas halotolerans]|uniref:ATP-binding protein n=1 Tax=Sinomonas halotolerans TaxID=1644133 RepID=A0ABU9X1U8_9MICC